MSLFNFFTRKPGQLPPVDMSVLHADMHSHLIPFIDDGAKSMEDSMSLIKDLYKMGFSKFFTTPHVMSDHYKNTPDKILAGLETVRTALKKEGLNVEIFAAAEYYLEPELQLMIENRTLLTFGKSYVLFELSMLSEPQGIADAVFNMQLAGYKPVLAHPERYGFWYNDFNKFIDMQDRGALFQMNTMSISGYYSAATKKISERLIDGGMISFLGTDCHHNGHISALERTRTEPYLHKLFDSGKLLNNTL